MHLVCGVSSPNIPHKTWCACCLGIPTSPARGWVHGLRCERVRRARAVVSSMSWQICGKLSPPSSQSWQACVLKTIFKAFGTHNRQFVEVGFNSPSQCTGSGSNTCALWRDEGWQGLLLDGANSNLSINLHNELVCELWIAPSPARAYTICKDALSQLSHFRRDFCARQTRTTSLRCSASTVCQTASTI